MFDALRQASRVSVLIDRFGQPRVLQFTILGARRNGVSMTVRAHVAPQYWMRAARGQHPGDDVLWSVVGQES